jgi:hypothetical protein
MKRAKATASDIDAAGDAMSVMNDISNGYYPAREGDECQDTFFDPDEFDHLRKFYDLMNATLEKSAGWPGRVIGAMCYFILYDKNEIVDPDADTLQIHPRFSKAAEQRDELLEVLRAIINDGVHCDVVPHLLTRARAAIAKAEGGAA